MFSIPLGSFETAGHDVKISGGKGPVYHNGHKVSAKKPEQLAVGDRIVMGAYVWCGV